MQPSAGEIVAIVAVSLTGSSVVLGMLLLTIRSIVRANLLTGLKTRCIAAGMNAEEIERVVMVGEGKCGAKYAKKMTDEYDYPVEKAPPVVSNRFAAAR